MITRLDKFLTDAGVCSRSQVKLLLKQGRVEVDGIKVKDGSAKRDYGAVLVTVDGETIRYEEFRYYLLNKPAGCVSATKDNLNDTVVELLQGVNTKDLFPVGRLDKDTEGLLLITNDGKLAHDLLSPKKHVKKCYFARLDGRLSEEDKVVIESGIDIGDDTPCLPAEIVYEGSSQDCVKIYITEGRYHQVKRMFAARGLTVTYLKRLSMGELILPDDLASGKFMKITKDQVLIGL